MMAAVLAEGTTVIEDAACEPEVQDLAAYLNACGARVNGAGTDTVTIEGVKKLSGAFHTLIPDRIEAGTFAAAAAITGGDLTLENVRPDHLSATISLMQQMGVRFDIGENRMRVWRGSRLSGADVIALPYPGIPTDMQPQLLALCCAAEGTSVVADAVFPERFTQVEDLRAMGAHITRTASQAVVQGPARLIGARVTARDLRGGVSLILAAMAAQGKSEVEDIRHVNRGYEELDGRLNAVGAHIVTSEAAAA
jgi:UDP-N-acetylglucosamine 1-carboxyvinyltransferase